MTYNLQYGQCIAENNDLQRDFQEYASNISLLDERQRLLHVINNDNERQLLITVGLTE